jgi:hypothetical protein
VRRSNGIRIIDRTVSRAGGDAPPTEIEHLVTWQEDGGVVVVLGLDVACRPVSMTTMYAYL